MVGRTRFCIATSAALALVAVAAPALAQQRTIAPADGGSVDQFGAAVAVDGDTLVVGAPGKGGFTGAAYVYTRTAGETWTQSAKLTASDGESPDHFGASVAIDGDTIVVGAPRDGNDAGSLYLFDRTGAATRIQREKLLASDASPGDALGTSVDIDGGTIVAGAPNDENAGSNVLANHGSVYTFDATGAPGRTQSAKLTVTGNTGDGGYRLGEAVAIDGATIVAGAPLYAVGTSFSDRRGAVYTFAATGASTRSETARLTSSANVYGHLGLSVDIQGDRIVAGDEQANDAYGTALVFASTGAADRHELEALRPANPRQNSSYGVSVSISANFVVVGARGYQPAGAGYVYTRSGAANRTESWFTAGGTVESGAHYATAIVTDDQRVIGGAPDVDVSSPSFFQDQGRVYSAIPDLFVSPTGSGSGTVTSSPGAPTGFPFSNCASSCTASYPLGTQVTLTATPAAGSHFDGWTSAPTSCTGLGSCVFTVTGDDQLGARFEPGPPPGDTTPPTVSIDSGPAAGSTVTAATATFGFSADENATFLCAHDSGAFAACTAGSGTTGSDTWSGLSEGTHTFKVKGTDAAGNTSTEVTRTFSVDLPGAPPPPPPADTTAPETTITSAPLRTVKVKKKKAKVTVAFSASEAATFLCSVDGAAATPCGSPAKFTLTRGRHTITVVAVDAAGNRDSTPATVQVKVKKKKQQQPQD